jgi:hypothetical protein
MRGIDHEKVYVQLFVVGTARAEGSSNTHGASGDGRDRAANVAAVRRHVRRRRATVDGETAAPANLSSTISPFRPSLLS